MEDANMITGAVVGAAVRIHQKLGPDEEGFRPDLIVNGVVIVEVKATASRNPVFERQLLTYQKILNIRLGLLLNFGMTTMKEGIHRIAN